MKKSVHLLLLAIAPFFNAQAETKLKSAENEGTHAAARNDGLAPLRFLVGYCWTGTFPDGENTDTHCYSDMYQGHFIRDVHTVFGKNPDYHGETIYHLEAGTSRISYRYWNSLGGVSDGIALHVDGNLLFPDEAHLTKDGKKIEIRSSISMVDGDNYVAISEQKSGADWHELWRITFTKFRPTGSIESQGQLDP